MSLKSKLKSALSSQSALSFYIIAAFSFLLLLPQIMTHSPILGVDALFHFNRFYDTAMQIDHGTFNYFQTMYGFNGNGRIINAVYGPIFAYLAGGLLLICKSWFVFEVVSSILVIFVAGVGVRYLARAMNVPFIGQIIAALLYMTMPLTNQWMLNQSFTAVGAAVLPFVLIYGVYFYTKKENYPWINLSVALATLTQIHFLSALIASLTLLIFFIGAQLRAHDTLKLLFWPLIRAMALFGLLISNLVITLIDVNSTNNLMTPFIPADIMSKSMHFSFGDASLRQYGLTGMTLIIFVIIGATLFYRQFSQIQRDSLWIGTIFIIASSVLIPWTTLRTLFPTIVNTLQFPSRLAVISSILTAILAGLIFTKLLAYKPESPSIYITVWLVIVGLVTLNVTNIIDNGFSSTRHFNKERVMKNRSYMVNSGKLSVEDERKAWVGNDLTIAMKMIQKQTPDYLPVSNLAPSDDAYLLYRHDLLLNPLRPIISASPELTMTWSAEQAKHSVMVPTIVYAHSNVTHNGHTIAEPRTSKVGALIIDQTKGQNVVTNDYEPNAVFWPVICLNLLTWIGAIIALSWPRQRKG
ncbi:glycosyltransferase family protein [Weissella ceti]|nr:hypothetical protein [Weissella ceti]QVK12048.1 hypothetical protein KHQ31_07540 [Weissella ceti]